MWSFKGNLREVSIIWLVITIYLPWNLKCMKVWLLTSSIYWFPVLTLLSAFRKDVDWWLPPSLPHQSLTQQRKRPCLVEELQQAGGNVPLLFPELVECWYNTLYIDSILCTHVLFFTSRPVKLMNGPTLPFLSNSITCSSCRSIRSAVC